MSDPSPAAASAAPQPAPQSYSTDPALYIYTSLTAGSSHIVTATSRLETILRANRVPFKAIDIATDEKARMLWGRRAGKDESGRVRKLPGLVQMGMVLGDLVEIEDWNEYGELKQHVTIYYDEFTQPPISQAPKQTPTPQAAKPSSLAASSTAPSAGVPPPAAPPLPDEKTRDTSGAEDKKAEDGSGVAAAVANKIVLPIRSIAEEAAAKAKQVHLQSLRDKVYGKSGSKESKDAEKAKEEDEKKTLQPTAPAGSTAKSAVAGTDGADDGAEEEEEEEEEEDDDDDGESVKSTIVVATSSAPLTAPVPLTPSKAAAAGSASPSVVAGLQSPTTGAWKDGGEPTDDNLLRTLQSPTTTSWRPVDVEPPVTSYRGSLVMSPSEEEIEAIERAEMIEEIDEPDESYDEAKEKK